MPFNISEFNQIKRPQRRKKQRVVKSSFEVTNLFAELPLHLDQWETRKTKRTRPRSRRRRKGHYSFLDISVPPAEPITLDKWYNLTVRPQRRKPFNRLPKNQIDFVEVWQEKNGNYQDTGVFELKITKTSTESASYADTDAFGLAITATHVEDYQLEDVEAFTFAISNPEVGNEIFNSGVPGFVFANVIIDGVNESDNIQGVISVSREDNAAARFKCTLEFDQTLVPPRKPAELIGKVVNISFAAADMDGVVADYKRIFVGICKHVTFNDDQQSMIMTGYDYGGVHQTRGEFVSSNVTDVLTGSIHVSLSGTHSLEHSPIWGIVWTGNSVVTDGEDYFINTLNGSIIVPFSSRILQFPGAFTYSYMNPFGSMKEIIQEVATLKNWTILEDNVTIEDYSSVKEHPVLSLSDESVIDVCRKFLELSGAKVETNLFPGLRVYSEVQNVINTVNTHTVDESKIFENSLVFRIDFDDMLNEQTVRSVHKINANIVVGPSGTIAEFSGSQGTTDPRTVQTDVVWWTNFNITTPTVLVEHRIRKTGLNSISFSATGRFFANFFSATFEESITGASWNWFIDGEDIVIQLRHTIVVLRSPPSTMWTFPAVDYTLTVSGTKINYGDGTIEDVKVVTAQRLIGGITDTLKGDVYENPYIETDQHCANICDAILLEHGNPYTTRFEIPVFDGKNMNIGDRLNINKDSNVLFAGIIKTLTYSINLATGVNSILVAAKGVGFGI